MIPKPNPNDDTTDREILITRTFEAPRELVWQAVTDPKHVSNWWGPRGFTTTTEEIDVRPGGFWKHTMVGPDGTRYPNYSIFKEIVKPERIVYLLGENREDAERGYLTGIWTFEVVDGNKTKVTLRAIFPSAEARAAAIKEVGAEEGGKQTLERLGEYLPTMTA